MLRALDPDETAPPAAYPLPWRVDRGLRAHPRVTNASAGVVDFVRVFVESADRGPSPVRAAPASMRSATEHWGQMLPGETVELCLCDVDPDDVVVTLAWFRPATGVEYVWRFVM
ncbi:hypothetical protein [Microbacterium ulmi]|uniref:Ig-like domain-containing protein n=1 Tax=Microbacterium ulmi TaxID=179095 RepID=A0A7Y2LYD6_9MICO|nr:hypothetical protein [Microbacterium ulmi]NII71370.1 hypothetical protein [Microbacterium ulmi]NNH02674.1 hypothetical protein [Microbacterium ulmi]